MTILDHLGNPISSSSRNKKRSSFVDISSYFGSLSMVKASADLRAQDPLTNHAWVFASAIAIATTAGQAPYTVYRENPEAELDRLGQDAVPQFSTSSASRCSMRFYTKSRSRRSLMTRSSTELYHHPIATLLDKPNEIHSKIDLFQIIYLWMAIEGEAPLVGLMKDGTWPASPNITPDRLYPVAPRTLKPVVQNGELVAWRYSAPSGTVGMVTSGMLLLPPWAVIMIRYPNPNNPLRGLSRIAAAAGAIQQDMMAAEHGRGILENGGDPGGILSYDGDLHPAERQEILEKFEQRHKGGANARRTALLSAGFKYASVGLTPQDMEHIKTREWDRAEILAVMGTPPSVLGVTEFVNYATDLGQKKNFWDHTIMPLISIVESALDRTLFQFQPDNIYGACDTSDVEALRSGLTEKIAIVTSLTSPQIGMPPVDAFNVVGLEVPRYDGDDIAVNGEPALPVPPNPNDPPNAPISDPGGPFSTLAIRTSKMKKASKRERWVQFLKLQKNWESDFGVAYVAWVTSEKNGTMERFEKEAAKVKIFPGARIRAPLNLTAILPDLKSSKRKLSEKTRPQYERGIIETYDFTVTDIGGIPTFELDDPVISDYFEKHETKFVNAVPETNIKRLASSLSKGIAAGESIQEIRLRIARHYKISASGPKTLSIARTETSSFINGAREAMFQAQGFEEMDWVSSDDEFTRESHNIFGSAGPQKVGFNYLTLLEDNIQGSLLFPGDLDAPPGERINCRCMRVPV